METLLVGITGLIFGSFVSLVVHRLPREEPIVAGRSRCPSCETFLGLPALVPVFSWVLQRGKCRYCKAPVSIRYPLTELSQAVLFLSVYVTHGLTAPALFLALFSVCLLALILIDFDWPIIPDELQYTALGLGLGYHFFAHSDWGVVFISAGLGLLIGLSLRFGFLWLRKKEGLGWGDVKFLPIAGLWLGDVWLWSPYLFYSGMFGVATAVIWRLAGKGARFPFGPALAAALFLMLLLPAHQWFYTQVANLLPR